MDKIELAEVVNERVQEIHFHAIHKAIIHNNWPRAKVLLKGLNIEQLDYLLIIYHQLGIMIEKVVKEIENG